MLYWLGPGWYPHPTCLGWRRHLCRSIAFIAWDLVFQLSILASGHFWSPDGISMLIGVHFIMLVLEWCHSMLYMLVIVVHSCVCVLLHGLSLRDWLVPSPPSGVLH